MACVCVCFSFQSFESFPLRSYQGHRTTLTSSPPVRRDQTSSGSVPNTTRGLTQYSQPRYIQCTMIGSMVYHQTTKLWGKPSYRYFTTNSLETRSSRSHRLCHTWNKCAATQKCSTCPSCYQLDNTIELTYLHCLCYQLGSHTMFPDLTMGVIFTYGETSQMVWGQCSRIKHYQILYPRPQMALSERIPLSQ